MKTKPINDLVLVELDNKKYGEFTSSVNKEGHEVGTLVAVSDKIFYLSSFSFVLEDSFKYPEQLEEIRLYWKARIGKKIRWESRSDLGTTFDEQNSTYSCIKITKILGVVDEDD